MCWSENLTAAILLRVAGMSTVEFGHGSLVCTGAAPKRASQGIFDRLVSAQSWNKAKSPTGCGWALHMIRNPTLWTIREPEGV
jgi:hypothetical protein